MNTTIETTITDSEWEVMRVVWAQGEATSKQIREVLQEKKNWKDATTKTFIGRLVKKGMLRTEAEGNKYIYYATLAEKEVFQNTLKDAFGSICSRDVGSAIADLISKSTLSFKDIENLENAIEMKKKEAVEEVPCNCVPGQCNCDAGCCSG